MFRSLALGSMSVGSAASCGNSSAASSYDSSSESNEWKNDLTEWNLEINKLTKYEISCMVDGSEGKGWAEFGIGFLNFFGGNYDYPDHWFLIAETKPMNFIELFLFAFSFEVSLKLWLAKAIGGVDKEAAVDEKEKEYLTKLIEFLSAQENNILLEIYGEEIMEDLVKKLKEIKEIKELAGFLKNLDNKKYTKACYFLIEKGADGKVVKFYGTESKILNDESKNYHKNKCNPTGQYYMNNKTTIKELKRYVETLSDSYNLIDDNCQDFVRNILNHYNL